MEDSCLRAFRYNHKEEAFRLLKVVKDPREVKGIDGSTLLHHAATQDWTDIMELLIAKYKFDVNCIIGLQYTMLVIMDG